ncbi:MAG: polysaccharide biosynthesis protein, partial [Mariprofundales bacterium]
MEKVAQAKARQHGGNTSTIISSVRYGNVMCSRGSVIPLFIGQMKSGKALTVTVAEMTRFLLPLSEAIKLVIFSFKHAEQGDILIRKASACTVEVLAKALKNIFHSDVPIREIGIRHGEKIFETLATRAELSKAEDMGDYLRVRMDDRDLNYNLYFSEGEGQQTLDADYTSHNTRQLDVSAVEQLLLTLPEVRRELP